MAGKVTLFDRLVTKMEKLGTTNRMAKRLAEGLVSTLQRPVKGSVTEKLEQRLIRLGLTSVKSKALAKGLAPVVRAQIAAKQKAKLKKAVKQVSTVHHGTPEEVAQSAEATEGLATDEEINEAISDVTDAAEDADLDKVAPRVNGHRLRLDMPVLPWDRGHKGVDVLRVVDGYSSTATYLVAAVKGEEGMVAIRNFGGGQYNLKFYPNMEHWGRTVEELTKLGARSYLRRQPYERMHVGVDTLTQVLDIIHKEAAPRSRIKNLMDRMKGITYPVLAKAFGIYWEKKKIGAAA